jgi:pyridoxamine 5'-phosphate oxidase
MTEIEDPYKVFEDWFEAAKKSERELPEAMCLSTASSDGRVSSRMVLLKAFDNRGFVFYTNTGSQKGSQLAANNFAALLFHWKSLKRQIRISGSVGFIDPAEADEYFASRPRASQIGAWASRQSEVLPDRSDLDKEFEEIEGKFHAKIIPRPSFWTGYRVIPDEFEFWKEGTARLHTRHRFKSVAGQWIKQMLYP